MRTDAIGNEEQIDTIKGRNANNVFTKGTDLLSVNDEIPGNVR